MGNQRRSGKKIEQLNWKLGVASALSLAGGNAVAVTVVAAEALQKTLMRIRGEFAAWANGVQAPAISSLLAVGIVQVPEGTGTTVLWDPFVDGDAPWIWFDFGVIAYEEMVTDVIDVPAITGYRRIVDSKAMRRMRNTELQLVVHNNSVQGGGTNVDFTFGGRFLFGT